MKTLSERASYLLDLAGNSTKELARIAGVRPASVSQWVNGPTKSLAIEPATRLANHFGLSAMWISKGYGPMRDLSLLSDTQKQVVGAESPGHNQGSSAMIYSMPKTVDASAAYTIRQYDAGGSMGHGLAMPDQPGVIENWCVSREWLQKNVRTHTGVQNLCIVTGFGPSMQPMFNPGHPLLVDTGVSSVIADGIYFFRVGSEAFVKQLQKIPTADGLKYVAKSKNKDYDDFEITSDMDFKVLGRVVRVWSGSDL